MACVRLLSGCVYELCTLPVTIILACSTDAEMNIWLESGLTQNTKMVLASSLHFTLMWTLDLLFVCFLNLKSPDPNFLTDQAHFSFLEIKKMKCRGAPGEVCRGAGVAFSSFKRIWYRLAELTQDKTARQACGRAHACAHAHLSPFSLSRTSFIVSFLKSQACDGR